MWKFLLATVAFGDFCFDMPGAVKIRVALQGSQINVNASAQAAWMGIGIPKTPQDDEMKLGNFVAGSGISVHDRALSLNINTEPNVHAMSLVPNASSASVVGGVQMLSYSRYLAPPGLIALDATKPFRLLWAHGALKPGTTGTSFDNFEYHGPSRGSFMVDLVKGNCAPVVHPIAPTAAPAPGKGKAGKGKGKKGKVCRLNEVKCTKAMQAQGNNCMLGKCTPKSVCESGQVMCTSAMQAQGNNCIVGKCVMGPSMAVVCTTGQVVCTSAMQAQGNNCVIGKCVPK